MQETKKYSKEMCSNFLSVNQIIKKYRIKTLNKSRAKNKWGSGKTASSLCLHGLHETIDGAIKAPKLSVDQKFYNGCGRIKITRTFSQCKNWPTGRYCQFCLLEASQGAPNTLRVGKIPTFYYSRNNHDKNLSFCIICVGQLAQN